jgi:hypothetical protein
MASTQPNTQAKTAERSYSRDEFTRWLTESCQRQHLPVTITNPTVLANIASLLR